MKKTLYYIVILSAILWACKKDFLVEDIHNKLVTVNSPANNTVTTINLVTFWWEPLDGAEKYNLQVVKPDFSSPVQLLLDTSITVNKFSFSLKPGTYQWRIKATNAGHTTAFQVFNIKIDTTSDLSEQLVNLLSPVNKAVTGNTLITFSWSNITVAKKYQLQINEGLTLDTTLTKTSLTFGLPAVKSATTSYTWRVKAINDASASQFSPISNTLTIDLKGPSLPLLTFPLIAASIKITDTLKWKYNSDVKYDSVFVAYDSLFSNMQQVKADLNFIPLSEFALPPNQGNTYYWWKIRSFDTFGNPSSYSSKQKFRIIP